jgi:hypothetical protein
MADNLVPQPSLSDEEIEASQEAPPQQPGSSEPRQQGEEEEALAKRAAATADVAVDLHGHSGNEESRADADAPSDLVRGMAEVGQEGTP